MTAITATFSNGFTDTYKGKRAVKAAWMITRKDTGEVLSSGHSLDDKRAQKTAEGNVQYVVHVDGWHLDVPRTIYLGANYSSLWDRAEKYGFTGRRGDWRALKAFARDHNAKRKAAQLAEVRIEVVAL